MRVEGENRLPQPSGHTAFSAAFWAASACCQIPLSFFLNQHLQDLGDTYGCFRIASLLRLGAVPQCLVVRHDASYFLFVLLAFDTLLKVKQNANTTLNYRDRNVHFSFQI